MTTSASQSISLRTLGNSDLQLTPIGFGAWAIGGGDWQFSWGPQDDNDSDCRHSSRARSGRQLDRYRGHLRAGPLGRGRRPRREILVAQALHLHQVLHALARRPLHLQLAQGRLAGRRGGGLAAAACRSKPSTSTRFTGPIPTSKSKRDGRRWRACASRASSAGSAFPISPSSR